MLVVGSNGAARAPQTEQRIVQQKEADKAEKERVRDEQTLASARDDTAKLHQARAARRASTNEPPPPPPPPPRNAADLLALDLLHELFVVFRFVA